VYNLQPRNVKAIEVFVMVISNLSNAWSTLTKLYYNGLDRADRQIGHWRSRPKWACIYRSWQSVYR